LRNADPSRLYLTHFDAIDEVKPHLDELEKILDDWALWMKSKWEEGLSNEEITPMFMAYTANQLKAKGVSEEGVKIYEAANPSWMSVAGLIRYWKKKEQ
ncbi:MAG: MBL fold metallo-hydrolase, partial [Cyclobacteriaceae bacterium]